MKSSIPLALVLALAGVAFAQDKQPTPPTPGGQVPASVSAKLPDVPQDIQLAIIKAQKDELTLQLQANQVQQQMQQLQASFQADAKTIADQTTLAYQRTGVDKTIATLNVDKLVFEPVAAPAKPAAPAPAPQPAKKSSK